MVSLLARLLFIHSASVASSRLNRDAISSLLGIREIQKPLFSMGLNGCKDSTLTNSIFLYYPLNFCVYNSQSHRLGRMFPTTYHNPSKSNIWIQNYINELVSAGIACRSLLYPFNRIVGYIQSEIMQRLLLG